MFFADDPVICPPVRSAAGGKRKNPDFRKEGRDIRKIRVTLDRIFLHKHDQGSLMILGI
jgi:hypothetical protein